jgi:hypothetical protein
MMNHPNGKSWNKPHCRASIQMPPMPLMNDDETMGDDKG